MPPSGRAPLDGNTITAPAIRVGAVASKTRSLNTFGVLLGAAIGGGVTMWRERAVTDRERTAQQADREPRRIDVRDAFQRDTIIELQDAIGAFGGWCPER